jgi:hypothetical protein
MSTEPTSSSDEPATTPPKSSPGGSPSSAKQYTVAVGILVAVMVLIGTILRECPEGTVTGTVRSTGPPLGDFVIKPAGCYRGGHWGFEGVFVVTETLVEGRRRGFRGGLKVMRSGSERWEAHVEIPRDCAVFKCPVRRIDPRSCRLFDVAMDHGFLRSNGHAHLDCEFREGGSLKANVVFDYCGAVPSSGDADL